MNLKRITKMLNALTAVSLIGSVAMAVWIGLAVNNPPAEKGTQLESLETAEKHDASSANSSHPDDLPLDRFSRLWGLPLQKPLDPPPPQKTAKTAPLQKKPPPLSIQLEATIIEANQSYGVFTVPPAETQVRRAGETVGNEKQKAVVVSVGDDHAVLSHNGQTVTLQLKEPKGLE